MKYFRELIALIIIGLFGFAYYQHPDDMLLQGALIAAFSTAYGYFLGSSKSKQDSDDRRNERDRKKDDYTYRTEEH